VKPLCLLRPAIDHPPDGPLGQLSQVNIVSRGKTHDATAASLGLREKKRMRAFPRGSMLVDKRGVIVVKNKNMLIFGIENAGRTPIPGTDITLRVVGRGRRTVFLVTLAEPGTLQSPGRAQDPLIQ